MKDPNPGSPEAVKLGCKCPVLDNANGRGVPLRNGKGGTITSFWINGECQLHGTTSNTLAPSNG